MKTLQIIAIFSATCLALSSMIGCGNGKGNDKSQADSSAVQAKATFPPITCTNPTGEFALDYGFSVDNPGNVYLFEKHELSDAQKNFSNIFTYQKPGQPFANPVQNLTVGNIFAMLDTVIATGNFNPNSSVQASDHAAIRINYGLDQQTIVPVFEPIILKPSGGGDPNQYSVVSTNVFFRLVANTLTQIPQTNCTTLMGQYQSTVSIQHQDTATTAFILSDDFDKGDTRYTIMPIQQILKMYCDNQGGTNPSATDPIYFSVVANNFFETGSVAIPNYKLHVIAYTGSIADGTTNTSYVGNGADFTQMCPPNCNAVEINYYEWNSNKTMTISTKKINEVK